MTDLFLSYISNHWRRFLFPLIAVAAILAFLFIPRGQLENEMILLGEQIPFQESLVEEVHQEAQAKQEESSPAIVIVDVQGAVTYPGVYTLEEGDRLIQAIDAAGGYIIDADTRQVNHALKVVDEMLIYIPLKGEIPVEEGTIVSAIESPLTNDGGGKVNINTATESELTTLAGIGPAKAAAIIQYREEQGPFQTPDALSNVTGIGQKTFEKLEQHITVK